MTPQGHGVPEGSFRALGPCTRGHGGATMGENLRRGRRTILILMMQDVKGEGRRAQERYHPEDETALCESLKSLG